MIQIRRNLFETNSSSTHSITMCTKLDYKKWKEGELVYDTRCDNLVPISEAKDIDSGIVFKSPQELFDWAEDHYFETFVREFNGVIAFGYYGYDN